MNRSILHRTPVVAVAVLSTLALGATTATASPVSPPAVVAAGEADAPPLTAEQQAFLDQQGPEALAAIEDAMSQQPEGGAQTMAFPIAAAAIAAAAWCAKGALASVPTSVIDDVANGGQGTAYVRNAIIGCLGGEIGGLVWKVVPGWAKKKAVEMVAAFVIKYVR